MGIQTVSQAYTNQGIGGFSFRNKIINGDMRINQRYAGTTLSASGTGPGYFLDRWSYYTSGQTITFSQGTLTSSDTPYAYGFRNTYKGTVAATQSAGAYWMSQVIEGYNIADLAWGTAFAKPITVSFWAKSSLTGNVTLAVKNTYTGASATYATPISVSPTWTFYTVTIPGPTSGSWGSSNDLGLTLQFTLSGGNASPTPSTWVYDNYYGLTGQLDFGANLNSTFEITGVQVEKGSSATPFEYRQYGQELALCQRYFESYNGDSNAVHDRIFSGGGFNEAIGKSYYVQKRAIPTVTWNLMEIRSGSNANVAISYIYASKNDMLAYGASSVSGVGNFRWQSPNGYIWINSEL